MVTSLIVALLLGLGFADNVNFANRRPIPEQNLTSAVHSNSEESRLKQDPLYQNRETAYTKYQFFRPQSTGKNSNLWVEKPNWTKPPMTAILKALKTGNFDVIANFARLEIVPTRLHGKPPQQPYVALPVKSQYNSYQRPSAFSILSQGYKPYKDMPLGPEVGFANSLPQLAIRQPVIQDTVAQLVSQASEPNGYAVPGLSSATTFQNIPSESSQSRLKMSEQVPIMTNSISPAVGIGFIGQTGQVPFENMYQRYQKMQKESTNSEKSYSELSKLYDIMNALKAVRSESSSDKNQQFSTENQTNNRPATKAIKNSSVPTHLRK